MPKTEKLCTKRSAVLARERREKEKKEHRYNAVLKEFLHFKYNHVITEFDSFYEKMKTDRPSNMRYTNTNEYRLWQKQYMEKAFPWGKEEQQQQQAEQQQDERQQQVEPPPQLNEQAEQQQDERQQVEPPPQLNEQAEQQQDERQQQVEPPPQLNEQAEPLLVEEEHVDPQLLDERQQQDEPPQQNELAHLVNDIVNEVEDIIPDHNDDEGIALDVWEELQGDIQEFDYHLEVELDRYLQ